MTYKGYTITRSGSGFYVQKPNKEQLCAEVPATVATAKKWIDMDVREQACRLAREKS